MASRSIATARCIILSSSTRMANPRWPPSDLGIHTRRAGWARYSFATSRRCRSAILPSSPTPYSATVIWSMPAAASLRSWVKASSRKSSSMRCARVVNTLAASRFDCSAISASFVETVSELNVPPVGPWRWGHARHCLPAALRLLSWVPWALVPHASGQGRLPGPAPRYCALLRLPSSFPVGSLLAPCRCLGLTRLVLCPARLAPGWAHLLTASANRRQGVGCAGHPPSGGCSQGDGRLSRVPGLPLCPHAPLSDPGGVPFACPGANRTAAFRCLDTVGFGSGCPDLSCGPRLYFFRSSITWPVSSPPLCFG